MAQFVFGTLDVLDVFLFWISLSLSLEDVHLSWIVQLQIRYACYKLGFVASPSLLTLLLFLVLQTGFKIITFLLLSIFRIYCR